MAFEKGIPTNVNDWKRYAKASGVLGGFKELDSQEKVNSASGFEYNHFLALQIIYPKSKSKSVLPPKIANQFLEKDDKGLNDLYGWNAYLDEIELFRSRGDTIASISRTCIPAGLGAMANVWLFQRHVLLGDEDSAEVSKVTSPVANHTRAKMLKRDAYTTPTPATKYKNVDIAEIAKKLSIKAEDDYLDEVTETVDPAENVQDEGTAKRLGTLSSDESDSEIPRTVDGEPNDGFYTPARGPQGGLIKDEQTVNVFLLAFLSAITATTVPFHTRWLAERNSMIFSQNIRYVARTDGHLRNESGVSFSLIEVKPRARLDDAKIRIQESAQMAAWISHNAIKAHNPDEACNMFLLSQDKDEIYLTFPYFGEGYGKYEKDAKDLAVTDFLRMYEYGPFRLRSKDDVSRVATFLHGYSLCKSKEFEG